MNLGLALRALGRHKVLVTFGIVVGVILAALSQYAVTMAPDGLEFTRRSHSTYSASAALVVDVPGLGVVRSDLPMDKNMQMAPTFAYLATTPDVLERVERTTGPLKDRVLITVEPVQYSPVVAYSVEGKDRALVAQVATELPKALSEYVSEYQDTGDVGSDVRLILRPLGSSGPPIEVQSRAIEIAALLFLLPVLPRLASPSCSRVEQVQARPRGRRRLSLSTRRPAPSFRVLTMPSGRRRLLLPSKMPARTHCGSSLPKARFLRLRPELAGGDVMRLECPYSSARRLQNAEMPRATGGGTPQRRWLAVVR